VEGAEDLLHWGHVGVVGGVRGGGAEIDGGRSGERSCEKEGEREEREFHGSMFIRITITLISAMHARPSGK
jgi:hypothetical protein